MPENKELYQATLEALTINGVPQEVADKAAGIIAQDDFTLANLGRSPEDQDAIGKAMDCYWANQSKEGAEK
ncbi:hypothetical protein H0X32_04165 [Patescibacteria group bacterium]|jgi:hypothetical protein|nr:hypothetical protein [Patescibacteria group bacterium]